MRASVSYDQITEVLVKGDQNSAMIMRKGQDGTIARISRPVGYGFDVMAVLTHIVSDGRPERRVDRQPHALVSTDLGEKRSPATAR